MLSRTGFLSGRIVQQRAVQESRPTRRYSKTEASASCPPKPCRIGPRPKSCRDPPIGFAPTRLATSAFKLPPFVNPKCFRKLQRKEILGPNASKCECYKNPEYYSHHRFSYYELMAAANAVKICTTCTK